MILVCGIGFNYFRELITFHKSINEAIKLINNEEKIKTHILKELEQLPGMQRRMKNYISSQNDSEERIGLDSFYNPADIIDEIGYRKITSSIPGILTALGILGTFWGLTQGLSSIDTGSIEATQNTVHILLSGIHVAFETSLWGIISSLVWNLLDKIYLEKFTRVIRKYITLFNEKNQVEAVSEEHKVLNILHKQSYSLNRLDESFRTFGDDISLKLADAIGNSMKNEIAPHFDEMSKQNDRLVEAIAGTQMDGMDSIVNSFMDQVNGLFGDQFENMSDTIEELLKWQKEVKESMNLLIVEIQETAKSQNNASEEMNKLIEKNIDLMKHINESTEQMDSVLKSTQDVCQTFESLTQNNKEYQSVIEGYSSKVSNGVNTLEVITNEFNNQAVVYAEELNKLNKGFVESSTSFSTNMVVGIDNTFKSFDDNLSSITKHLSEVVVQIRKSSEDIPDLLEDIKENIISFNETITILNEEEGVS